MFDRRTVIKGLAALGSALLVPLEKLGPLRSSSRAHAQGLAVGELYAGFLLLPDGAPLPPTVAHPKLGIPIVCGVGVGRGGPAPTAVSESLSTAADLIKEVEFPIYTLGQLPTGFRPSGASLIRHQTGEVFVTSVEFQSYNEKSDSWATTVNVWAQPDFPRPYPLWSSAPVEPEARAIVLEKADFLPSPGIMIATPVGFVFHWIQKDILYTLIAEHSTSLQDARVLVNSLVVV